MGYDCTLHLVDEELLRTHFVPRLLAEVPPRTFLGRVMGRKPPWPPTSFDKIRRDAPQLWSAARTALNGDDPSGAARQICELGILFSSCELPFESARGIALSLWPLEPAPFNPDLPADLLGSPEEVFGELVATYPDLEGEFPSFFDGNGSPGAYISAARVPAAHQWVNAWVETLPRGQRRHYIGLLRVLEGAAQKGYAYWEATDLDVERIDSDLLDRRGVRRESAVLRVQKHVLPFTAYLGAGESGPLLAVSDQKAAKTAIFDMNVWPPPERARTDQYAFSAARAADGRWAMISALGGQKQFSFDLRVYDQHLNSPRVLEAQLDGKRIEPKTAGWSGDRAVAFAERPVAFGSGGAFTTERLVFIESGKQLTLIATLPSTPLPKPGSVFRGAIGTARAGTGADLLIWDGHGYERQGDAFVKTFSLDADDSHRRWTSAPARTTGIYFLSGCRLYESHSRRVPVRRAAAMRVGDISPGPEESLLLTTGGDPDGAIGKVYFPTDDTFISISPEILGESAEYLHRCDSMHFCEGSASVVVRLGSVMWAIPWKSLRERAQVAKQADVDRVELLLGGPAEWNKVGDCYRDGIVERVLHQWGRQPAAPNASGTMQLSFAIVADGSLGDAVVINGVGLPAEAALLAALRAASPFRALPEGVSSLRVEATLRVGNAPAVVVPKLPASLGLNKPRREKPLGPRQRLKAMRALLPGGPESLVELQYLFRGAAAEGGTFASIDDIVGQSKTLPRDRAALERLFSSAAKRFLEGQLDPMPPARPENERSTQLPIVDRARRRLRETGAFMLGQVLAKSENSTSDAVFDTLRQTLIEQSVRFEMIAEPLDSIEGDTAALHLELDDLESKTEASIADIERHLRRTEKTA